MAAHMAAIPRGGSACADVKAEVKMILKHYYQVTLHNTGMGADKKSFHLNYNCAIV